MSLASYRIKRTFAKTPEPPGGKLLKKGPLTFVVQKHQASRLHYDFRLELDGVLKSWAVPKGPSLNPDDKRLAMMVEDHPLEYAGFEGIIPKGNYGAGTVMVWDTGIYSPYLTSSNRKKAEKLLQEQLLKGHLTFVLLGEKLKGEFALVKIKSDEENAWLLIKANDEYASKDDVLKNDRSITTKRTMDEIAKESVKNKKIWISKHKGIDFHDAPIHPMPHEIKPMLAQTVDTPFNKRDWIFELKWDGYRAIAEIESGNASLYSRNNISYNQKYAPIVQSLTKFPVDAVLDGEIVVLNPEGRAAFQLLQEYPDGKGELYYYVFDILYADGHDLRDLPLVRRKEILRELLPALPHIRLSDYVSETGKAFFFLAKKMNLEGIMAKHVNSPYRMGERSHDWLKMKTIQREEAIIAGFTKPNGGRKYFGALILGIYKNGKLKYIGHAGGGFTDPMLVSIHKKLQPLIQKTCPFDKEPKTNTPVTWVRPHLVCSVTFKEWTKDHVMRQPIFLGLREDKHLEADQVQRSSDQIKIGERTLTLTNLSKVFWPKEKYTKGDVIKYYSEISSIILPYLIDRPQSLLRFPDGIEGEQFFQKDMSRLSDKWIKRTAIQSESENKVTQYLLCQDTESLIYIINLGCIDLNPWNSRVGHIEYPDYLILDLDPEKTSFESVIKVALVVRNLLEQLEVQSFCKTSGKRGFHIYIPTGAKYTYEQVRQFTQLLCLQIQKQLPRLVSLKHNPKDRQGKVYLDYLRNARGQTTASVYSMRAWPKATVSTPLSWKEVTKRLRPDQFTIQTLRKRIDKHGDLFKGMFGKGIDMKKCLSKLEAV